MADPREEIRRELASLVREGHELWLSEQAANASDDLLDKVRAELAKRSGDKAKPSGSQTAKDAGTSVASKEKAELKLLAQHYQVWYSRALRVVAQLLPDRYDEFRSLYQLEKRKEIDVMTYTVSDYLRGIRVTRGLGAWKEDVFNASVAGLDRFNDQVKILESAAARLDSLLADIRGLLEATLFDDELATSRELLQAKHVRSAGVVAGVVLERHLKRVMENRAITSRKKPLLANLNQALKDGNAYDVPEWRRIQRLTDLRNVAAHDGDRDPTREEIDELILGVERVVATVF